MTDRRYKGVSLEAKVLYGLLLDRMGLSARNGWLDDNGRVFLYFTQEEVMTMLDCGKDKATKLFRELEGIGLVERKKQGQGHPARIYVKNFILEPEPAAPVQTAENQQSRPLDSAAVKTAEKPQSARRKTSGQECGISAPIKLKKAILIYPSHPLPPQRFLLLLVNALRAGWDWMRWKATAN